MVLLLLAGVALVGTCAALVGRAIALPRVRAVERLSQIDAYGYGVPEQTAETSRAVTGAVDRLAKRLGRFAAGRLLGLSEANSRKELMAAGMYHTAPATLIGYRLICAVSLPIASLWLATASGMSGGLATLLVLIMLGLGWLAPVTLVRRRARLRLARIDADLPELVDLLVVTVESGLGFAGSMQIAAERFHGPLGDEMRLAMQEQLMGLSLDRVLANMLARSDTESMRSFIRPIRQGDSLGVSIGQIMRNLATEMRKRRRAAAEERAQKAPIKILFPLVGLIFPALFIVLLAPALLSFISSIGGGT
ncbi:MAG: type II secretion system F family protein [Actinomycetota bacterium]|nr:type II secretion system F family protein [Actinomycetota bacterium]